jgi:hypothetical protein
MVFSLPAPIADIAYQNEAVIYSPLFKVAAEALIIIAADPKHLGARIGITSVLHTSGSAIPHRQHGNMIVSRWTSTRAKPHQVGGQAPRGLNSQVAKAEAVWPIAKSPCVVFELGAVSATLSRFERLRT